jgi:hypothetical protein
VSDQQALQSLLRGLTTSVQCHIERATVCLIEPGCHSLHVLRSKPTRGWVPCSAYTHLALRYAHAPCLNVNLIVGEDHSNQARDRAAPHNGRELFESLALWAPQHLKRVDSRLRGVHLLFHLGLSHFGLTYWVEPRPSDSGGTEGGFWMRKVSLILPDPTARWSVEFVFTFGFVGTFGQYC